MTYLETLEEKIETAEKTLNELAIYAAQIPALQESEKGKLDMLKELKIAYLNEIDNENSEEDEMERLEKLEKVEAEIVEV